MCAKTLQSDWTQVCRHFERTISPCDWTTAFTSNCRVTVSVLKVEGKFNAHSVHDFAILTNFPVEFSTFVFLLIT